MFIIEMNTAVSSWRGYSKAEWILWNVLKWNKNVLLLCIFNFENFLFRPISVINVIFCEKVLIRSWKKERSVPTLSLSIKFTMMQQSHLLLRTENVYKCNSFELLTRLMIHDLNPHLLTYVFKFNSITESLIFEKSIWTFCEKPVWMCIKCWIDVNHANWLHMQINKCIITLTFFSSHFLYSYQTNIHKLHCRT